jgi:hypothetical protein
MPAGETTATAATGHADNSRDRSAALTSSPEPATGAVAAAVEVVPSAVVVRAGVLTGLVTAVLVVDATAAVLVDGAVVLVALVVTVVDGVTVVVVAVVVGGESANAVATPTANSSSAATPANTRPSGIHDNYATSEQQRTTIDSGLASLILASAVPLESLLTLSPLPRFLAAVALAFTPIFLATSSSPNGSPMSLAAGTREAGSLVSEHPRAHTPRWRRWWLGRLCGLWKLVGCSARCWPCDCGCPSRGSPPRAPARTKKPRRSPQR